MPVSFSSPPRNLFLLGSSGADVVTNFFHEIDKSSASLNKDVFVPDEIRFDYDNNRYNIAGTAETVSTSKEIGWIERRDCNAEVPSSTNDWSVHIEATATATDTTLRAMESYGNNLIVVGKTGSVPWIAKYSNGGIIDWQTTTNSYDVEYTGVCSDGTNYYACGNTPVTGTAQAFVEKFDSVGNPSWGKSAFMVGRDVVLEKISANTRGEVIAVGYIEDDSADKGYIIKIDTSTGKVLWDRTLERNISGGGGGNDDIAPADVRCTSTYIDGNDQIYVVGSINGRSPVDNGVGEFLIKYSPEGNILWQRENNTDHYTALNSSPNMIPFDVKSDTDTQQTVVLSVQDQGSFALNDSDIFISKYSRDGSLVFRRKISKGGNNLGSASLDADPSFYYILFRDQQISSIAGEPDRYFFGKVSTSGNGLGDFQYDDGGSTPVDYIIVLNAENKIGRLSDGSIRNDESDLITYPFTANRLLFDDYATLVSNKKRQMDSADSFEYSGSPAVRPSDFQELNLLGGVYSGSGDWLDQSGKGNNGVTTLTVTTTAEEPFSGAGSVQFDGTGDYLDVSDPDDFDFDGDFTVEFYVYFDTVNSRNDTIGSGNNSVYLGANKSGWIASYYTLSGSKWHFSYQSDESWIFEYTFAFTSVADTWYHVAFTRSGSDIRCFVDGVQQGSTQTSSATLTSSEGLVRVGGGGGSTSLLLNGNLSNVRIVKGAALYTSNFTPPSSSLTVTTPGGKDWTADGSWTWSNGSASSITNRQILFDGDITSGYPSAPGGNPGQVRYTFSPALTGYYQVRIRTNTHDDTFAQRRVAYNGASGSNTISTGSNTSQWVDITSNLGGTFNWVEWGNYGGADGNRAPSGLLGIEVDGTLLVDIDLNATELLTAQGASISDASANSFNIIVNGNAVAAVGGTTSNTTAHNAGGWFEFDGVDDTIDLGTTSLIAPSSSFSIEAWCWVDSLTNECTIYEITADGNSDTIMLSAGSTTDGNVGGRFIVRNTSGSDLGVRDVINNNLGEWHHYVGVHINDGNFSSTCLYVDGVQLMCQNLVGALHTFDFTNVGVQHLGLSAGSRYLDGRIGEVRIYPRALTEAQVFQNYNSTKPKYINEAPDTAPKIGSGIVYDSNLLLNYDFGNRATYDRAENILFGSENWNHPGWVGYCGAAAKGYQGVDINTTDVLTPFGDNTALGISKQGTGCGNDNAWGIHWKQSTSGGSAIVQSGETYTVSAYLRGKVGGETIDIGFDDGAETQHTLTTEWVRYTHTGTPSTGTSRGFQVKVPFPITNQGFYIWHPQVESGSSVGRYVGTYGSAITAPTTVKNLSSDTDNGTLVNGVTFNSDGHFDFGGVDGKIETFLSSSAIGNTFSAEVWIYPTDFSAPSGSPTDAYPRRIMTCHRFVGSTKWCLGIDTSGKLGFGGAGGVEEAADKKYQLSLNTYYHVVLTHDGTSYKIYVNGTEQVDQTTSPIDSNHQSNLAIGGRPTGYGDRVFEGRIAQARIYNDLLSSSEVSQNFNATRGKYGV